MSYNSRKNICSMATGLLLAVVYGVYALGDAVPAAGDIKGWAVLMLVFIGIGVAAVVVIQILFHIAMAVSIAAKERDKGIAARVLSATTLEDERDRAVALKASQAGYAITGLGFCAMLGALAFGASIVLALHVMFAACMIASLVEGGVSVYLFERGQRNG